ncbi:hypothetical protein HanXRQr2_Chr16g0753991 [Helianthus annuus]|uniref:AT hook, DNA-binding motif-containing protein n=1 Tax=Helianthus annuus TaxID=4232 RepID=A0A251S0A0_HELAN|nr:hypothetical protein HanXRQr2_Chr16g0753991 [Helianthus annuus]KAJ0821648.1 hypothetical protein HanPSC8_Chr16g0722701 [Helianthus annuus]
MSKTPCSSCPDLPIKRKRGRPRKDESMARNEKRQIQASIPSSQPPPMAAVTTLQPPPMVAMNPIGDNHNIMGQVVTGVIDGVFDAGYLISIRVGPNNTILRGLVFQQGHYCPITPTNDVTPHLKMCRRENFQIPQVACMKQPSQVAMHVSMQNYQTTPIVAGGSGNVARPPPERLRMVEQDELMHAFEVSNMVEEQVKNDECGHGLKNDQLLSDCDLMAESLPRNEVVNHPQLPCNARLVQDVDHESAIDEADKREQQEGENAVLVTRVETGMEEPPLFEKDESVKQEGEVNKIDVNEDPNQGVDLVATDLIPNQD